MLSVAQKIVSVQNTSKYSFSNRVRPNSVKNDTFVRQQRVNPSFGSIPRATIFKSVDKFLEKAGNTSDSVKLSRLSNDFFNNKFLSLLSVDVTRPQREIDISRDFRHEVINQFQLTSILVGNLEFRPIISELYPEVVTDAQYLKFQQSELKKTLHSIKDCTFKWAKLEKWSNNPDKKFPMEEIIDAMKQIANSLNINNIKVDGLDLIRNKKVQNPAELYKLVSQPLLNAIKYGEGKPIEIKIGLLAKNPKTGYYASFINPETKPIPNNQIDKILQGNFYRTPDAVKSGISGSGQGFTSMIQSLKENHRSSAIPNLIEKDRPKGVCVQVPLIGVI